MDMEGKHGFRMIKEGEMMVFPPLVYPKEWDGRWSKVQSLFSFYFLLTQEPNLLWKISFKVIEFVLYYAVQYWFYFLTRIRMLCFYISKLSQLGLSSIPDTLLAFPWNCMVADALGNPGGNRCALISPFRLRTQFWALEPKGMCSGLVLPPAFLAK